MSLARRHMTHRATVERDANLGAGSTGWGSDPSPSWSANLTDQPCWYWFAETDSRTNVSGESLVAFTTRKVIFPLGTDIEETDRISTITDRQGVEVADGPMRITSIGRRSNHLLVTVAEER